MVKIDINADYSALTETTETNPKAPKIKTDDRFRVTKYNNLFSKGYTENSSREIFIINTVLKTNPWTYKIKDVKEEKIIGNFLWKRYWVNYNWVIIPNQTVILEIKSQ